MTRYDRSAQMLAVTVAALAGYVDAIGFMGSGAFFVSFMSGNSTRLGVGLATHADFALRAGALIAAFVCGVTVTSLAKRRAARPQHRAAVLAIAATALTLGGLMLRAGSPFAPFPVIAFAMGAINLLFEEDGDVRIGLTYMTGALVKLGHRLADALSGGDRRGWIPFLALWLGLVAGGCAGALAFLALGPEAIWIAAAAAWALLALVVRPPT